MRTYNAPVAERLCEHPAALESLRVKLEKHSCPEALTGCVLWSGSTEQKYGRVSVHIDGKKIHAMAHRLAFEFARGPIPETMTLDHLCRTTLCVNPDHMEMVTNAENASRQRRRNSGSVPGSVCARGHIGAYYFTDKWKCRICVREDNAAKYYRDRANGFHKRSKTWHEPGTLVMRDVVDCRGVK